MNALQMLINSESTHAFVGTPTAPKSEGMVNLPLEQQFDQILAQFVELPLLEQVFDQEGGANPATEFELALAKLLSTLYQENGLEMMPEDGVGAQISNLPNALFGEENHAWEQLVQYLQLFSEEMENDSLSYEALYHLFTSLPELPSVLTTNHVINQVSMFEGGRVAMPMEADEATSHWTRWAVLLNRLNQVLQHEQQHMEKNQQVHQLLQDLISKWGQDREWLSFLQQNIVRETGRIQVEREQAGANVEKPIYSTFLPLSLLKQASEEQGRGNLLHQSLTQHTSNQENHVNLNSLTNLSMVSGEREVTIQVGEKIQHSNLTNSSPNSTEDTSSLTARLAHIVEDMQGIMRKQISLLKDGEATQLRVRLTPEHLGSLDIRITSENGKVIAQIFTSSKLAKEVLDLQLHQLRASLTQQGIQVERMEVSQHPNSSNNLLHQEQKESQHFQQKKGQKNHLDKQHDYLDFDEIDGFDELFTEQGSQINYAV